MNEKRKTNIAHFKIIEVNGSDVGIHEEDLMTPDLWVAKSTFICRWNSKSKEEKAGTLYFTLYQQDEVKFEENSCITKWHPIDEYLLGRHQEY